MLALLLAAAAGLSSGEHRALARFFPPHVYLDDAELLSLTDDNPARLDAHVKPFAVSLVGRVSAIERSGARYRLVLGPRDPFPRRVIACDVSSRRQVAKLTRGQLVLVSGMLSMEHGWRLRDCKLDFDFSADPAVVMRSYERCSLRYLRDLCTFGGRCGQPERDHIASVAPIIESAAEGQEGLLSCGAPIFGVLFKCDGSEGKGDDDPMRFSCRRRRELLDIRNEGIEEDGRTRRESGNVIAAEKPPASRLYNAMAKTNGWEDNP